MANGLRNYFPMIRERDEILREIAADAGLEKMFDGWSAERQEEFLGMCTGVKGVKLLYDPFFKEVMNPEYAPGRLSSFLSLVIGETVSVRQVLPNDSTRIADETSLLITDIVVEFGDGSLGNLEVQKVGYAFPGERCSCYSADLLLRQYKRVRDERRGRNEKFSYRDIRRVYTIVLFEHSGREFHRVGDAFVHRFIGCFDTGLEIELLQKYILIPLDIFRETMHNKPIGTELEAWLTFLSTDEPGRIMELAGNYPEFRKLYGEVYEMCRNTERVMGMFSKELQEMDRNTVQYMIDEMQEELDRKSEKLEQASEELEQTSEKLDRTNEELGRTNEELGRTSEELGRTNEELGRTNEELGRTSEELGRTNEELGRTSEELGRTSEELGRTSEELNRRNEELAQQKQKYEEAMKRIRELEEHRE